MIQWCVCVCLCLFCVCFVCVCVCFVCVCSGVGGAKKEAAERIVSQVGQIHCGQFERGSCQRASRARRRQNGFSHARAHAHRALFEQIEKEMYIFAIKKVKRALVGVARRAAVAIVSCFVFSCFFVFVVIALANGPLGFVAPQKMDKVLNSCKTLKTVATVRAAKLAIRLSVTAVGCCRCGRFRF